jgi:putative hydrolase of HD superfamily
MNILKFAHEISSLKSTKRTGWVRSLVADPESIADHMYRMALLAFMIPENANIDRNKIIKMALVHDVAEAKVGDITPHDGVSDIEKRQLESKGMDFLVNVLENSSEAKEMKELWLEYENGQTLEAQIVKDLDKFEMICQAFEYEKSKATKESLDSFFESTAGKFKTDIVKTWVSLLLEERKLLK